MYENEDDFEFKNSDSKLEKFKSLFLVQVAINYGIAYAVIFGLLILSWIMIVLPATIKWGYDKTAQLINFLSKENPELVKFYWGVLIASWVGVVIIFLSCKICDYVLDKKYSKKEKSA